MRKAVRQLPTIEEFAQTGLLVPTGRIAAAVPLLLFAATYFVPVLLDGWTLPGLSAGALGRAMQTESLVLMAGGFMVFPVLAPIRPGNPSKKGLRVVQWGVFLLFFANFTNMAWQGWGPSASISFGFLLALTYGGALLNAHPKEGVAHWLVAIGRWVLTLVLFVILVEALDVPSNVDWWHRDARVLPLGGCYFAALGLLELSGLYRWSQKQLHELGLRYS